VALAVLAGVALLLAGRAIAWRPSEGGPLLVAPATPQDIFVHVAGEVLMPGVYRLRAGARWADAVQADRGAALLADLDAVNLAQALRDGDRVYVPRLPEPVVAGQDVGRAGTERAGTAHPPIRRDAGGPSPLLDLNAASAAELEALPGIGPVLAARIVEYRQTHGRFQHVEDLQEVEGIGPRLLERLRPLLRVR
jgi:competence protein ComEA